MLSLPLTFALSQDQTLQFNLESVASCEATFFFETLFGLALRFSSCGFVTLNRVDRLSAGLPFLFDEPSRLPTIQFSATDLLLVGGGESIAQTAPPCQLLFQLRSYAFFRLRFAGSEADSLAPGWASSATRFPLLRSAAKEVLNYAGRAFESTQNRLAGSRFFHLAPRQARNI